MASEESVDEQNLVFHDEIGENIKLKVLFIQKKILKEGNNLVYPSQWNQSFSSYLLELEDFEYDEDEETYYYPCPCGDRFSITKEDLEAGEEIAECPSCSLIVKVKWSQN